MTLGERIKIRREALGMTLLQLAQKTGVSEATVQRYESGEIKTPRHMRLISMAEALGVDVNYLLTGNEESVAEIAKLNEMYADQYRCCQLNAKGEKEFFVFEYRENNVFAYVDNKRCDFTNAFFRLDTDLRKNVILDMLKRYC